MTPVSTAEFICIVVSTNVKAPQGTESALKVWLRACKFGLTLMLKLLACRMMSIGSIVRHGMAGEAQMTTTPVLSNSCVLTKIEISGSKVRGLVELGNLCDSTLLSAAKLTSRPGLIVGHTCMSVSALDMEEDKFGGTS